MKLLNVGFSNFVSESRIVAVALPEAEPIKRLVRDAKEDGRVIDATSGKRTRSVIVTDTEHVILSALPPEKLADRAEGLDDQQQPE